MAVNAVIAIGLAPILGWYAPAIATTIAGWAMVGMLAHGARGLGEVARFDQRFWQRVWRICLSALAMGAVLLGADALLDQALHTAGLRYLALAGLIGLGIAVYFVGRPFHRRHAIW